jgi:DNA-binding transcriptional ArsR family regulator
MTLIDRIRHDIEERLEELQAEVEKLRRAHAALDPRQNQAPAKRPTPRVAKPTPRRAAPSAPAAVPPRRTTPQKPDGVARAASGSTKARVLAALSTDRALTAGEVAKATGLGQGTVSTTLSKLAKSGGAAKAERGYRLPAAK